MLSFYWKFLSNISDNIAYKVLEPTYISQSSVALESSRRYPWILDQIMKSQLSQLNLTTTYSRLKLFIKVLKSVHHLATSNLSTRFYVVSLKEILLRVFLRLSRNLKMAHRLHRKCPQGLPGSSTVLLQSKASLLSASTRNACPSHRQSSYKLLSL